jgi:acyl-CoA synthetase (AMP-forming)/AMP-acid ligase II
MPGNGLTVVEVLHEHAERRSALLARALIAWGAGKGTHVGLLYPNGVAFLVGMLAAARIGAVVVPFSTFATTHELREQLAHSDVEILLSASSYRSHDYTHRLRDVMTERLDVPQLRHVIFDHALTETVDQSLFEATESEVVGSDPLAIIYTSGSTSAPKGVVHTHAALLGHQRNLNEIRGLGPDDKLFCNSPFFWIGGFAFALLATLVAGSTLVCSNAVDAGDTLDLLESERPTLTNGFTSGVAHLVSHPSFAARDLSSLRQGNLYPIMAPEARPAEPELRHNMLGSTEAGSVLLLSEDESDQPEHRRGSFGRPAPGFETKVIDRGPDGIGELCIRGPYVMQRYYGHSREECFDGDGWFHTADLVRVDADGFYYFVGRRGAMIKTAGANVAPAEVENAIAKVSGRTAYVVGVPDPHRGELVGAVVVADRDVDVLALRRTLECELSSFKVPKRFVVISSAEVPLMTSGKVDIQALARLFDV